MQQGVGLRCLSRQHAQWSMSGPPLFRTLVGTASPIAREDRTFEHRASVSIDRSGYGTTESVAVIGGNMCRRRFRLRTSPFLTGTVPVALLFSWPPAETEHVR